MINKDKILRYIKSKEQINFVELEMFMDKENIPYKGNLSIVSSMFDNKIIFWTGFNEYICNILDMLEKEGKIKYELMSELELIFMDKKLKLPLIKEMPKRELKKEHWLPVLIVYMDNE